MTEGAEFTNEGTKTTETNEAQLLRCFLSCLYLWISPSPHGRQKPATAKCCVLAVPSVRLR